MGEAAAHRGHLGAVRSTVTAGVPRKLPRSSRARPSRAQQRHPQPQPVVGLPGRRQQPGRPPGAGAWLARAQRPAPGRRRPALLPGPWRVAPQQQGKRQQPPVAPLPHPPSQRPPRTPEVPRGHRAPVDRYGYLSTT